MKPLHRIALLAGGALVAAAATGCSSSAAQPAASGPATSGISSTATVSDTSDTSDAATSSAPDVASSSASATATTAPSRTATSPGSKVPSTGASSTGPDSFPPLCDNAKLDTSLAPAGGGLGGRGNVIDAGQTLYAGIDLDPHSASNAVAGYTTLEVIPNRVAGAGDKGARALQLPAPAKVADAQLGTYSRDIAGALRAMTYASIPEE